MIFIFQVLIIAAALAAAFFYVSKIISTLPIGRAEDYLNSNDQQDKKIIACIGDSLTHGNIGQSWVDYLREEFPNDIFLNEGINANTTWQVLQRLEPIFICKPDLVILMIGTNDALGSFDIDSGLRYKKTIIYLKSLLLKNIKNSYLSLLRRLEFNLRLRSALFLLSVKM